MTFFQIHNPLVQGLIVGDTWNPLFFWLEALLTGEFEISLGEALLPPKTDVIVLLKCCCEPRLLIDVSAVAFYAYLLLHAAVVILPAA